MTPQEGKGKLIYSVLGWVLGEEGAFLLKLSNQEIVLIYLDFDFILFMWPGNPKAYNLTSRIYLDWLCSLGTWERQTFFMESDNLNLGCIN